VAATGAESSKPLTYLTESAALFAAAFLSVTVFPFQSEVMLFGRPVAEQYREVALSEVRADPLDGVQLWRVGREGGA
jgi:membrane protein YqaA with SNARE-associated domain